MTDSQITSDEFKQTRSDLLVEIKGEIILLNESLTKAEVDYRFMNSDRPKTKLIYADVYYHLAEMVKLTRELLPPKTVLKIDNWLNSFQYSRQTQGIFLEYASNYARIIQVYLYDLGIKDTNIRKHIKYPWDFYLKEQQP